MLELDGIPQRCLQLDGKQRRIERLKLDGHFAILAIDHTQSLKDALSNVRAKDDQAIAATKLNLIRNLSPVVGAVLVDPMVGASTLSKEHAIGCDTGLIISLEELDYSQPYAEPSLMPDWSAHQALVAGADAAKLLVYFRPDGPDAAQREDFVRQAAKVCTELQLPLLLEPLAYPVPSDPPAGISAEISIEIARRMAATGPDILKLPFPSGNDDEAARTCGAITEVANGIPWVLLSQGVSPEQYAHQLSIAAESGAEGYAVGRSLWLDIIQSDDHTQRSLGAERLRSFSVVFTRGIADPQIPCKKT